MSFVGKLGALLKNFAMKALEIALHGVPSNKIEDLLKMAKVIVTVTENAIQGPGRGQERYEAALSSLLMYAMSEGINLLEFQANKLLEDAFAATVGARKVLAAGANPLPTTTGSTPPPSA